MGSPDDIVPESEELYIVLHVNDIDVPLSQPESGGRGFGPFPTKDIARAFAREDICECDKVVIPVRRVKPFFIVIGVELDELESLGTVQRGDHLN